MPVIRFPDPETADADGVVAWGGDLHPLTLQAAYKVGIFPWPIGPRENSPIPWFSPPERAILEWKDLHLPKSLLKEEKRGHYQFTVNHEFEEVIRACAKSKRKGQRGTWITQAMIEAYCKLHHLGFAHSVEVWEGEHLVGGIYGVSVGGYFSGESMFHRKPNTSKLALIYLMRWLNTKGLNWIDIQVMTPHMEALGAKLISRKDFTKKIKEAAKNISI